MTLEQRRADYAQLLQPGAGGQPAVAARRRRPRAAAAVAHRDRDRQRRRFFPRHALYRDRRQGRQLRAGLFPRTAGPTCRSRCRIPASTPASPSPKSTCASSPISSATPRSARPASPMWSTRSGQVLASSARGPEVGKDLSALPQVAALLKPDGEPLAPAPTPTASAVLTAASAGAEARLVRVVRAADRAGAGADPRPAGADRASDRARACWSRSSPARCWRGAC